MTYDLPLRVSVIQGNIPQNLKWDPDAKSYILDKYTQLTKQAVTNGVDLVIWPEAASPGLLGQDQWVFKGILNLSKEIKIPILIGSVVNEGDRYFNSALLFDKDKGITARYDKIHLVPFGEYIPLKKILPFLEAIVPIGDISAGKNYTVFTSDQRPATSDSVHFSVLICFEDLFPELSREFVKRGADFLVNITNDAWYKKTSAASQHLEASIFRAVENGVYLARAANTGISGFIAPSGKIISTVRDKSRKDIFVDGYQTQDIILAQKQGSFYTKFGDLFILLMCVLALAHFFYRK